MRRFFYRAHVWLSLIVAIPVLAWTSSGLLYSWPNAVEGGKIENIDAISIQVSPSEALLKANAFAGKKLPTTALTLLMRDGTTCLPGNWRNGRGFAADRCRDRCGNQDAATGRA